MELAAGKVKSKPVKSAHGVTDVVQWTFATAAANHLNVVRAFAHGTDSSFPLQTSAGAALSCVTTFVASECCEQCLIDIPLWSMRREIRLHWA